MERAFVVPPGSQLGPLTEEERAKLIQGSDVFGHYEKAVDRESAYEKLKERTEAKPAEAKESSNPVSDIPRQDRAARRTAVPGRHRSDDQERGARHRLGARPAGAARGIGLDLGGKNVEKRL